MAVSITIVWKVPTLIALIVDKKMLEGPITLERNCNNAIARSAIQGARVLQKFCTRTGVLSGEKPRF